MKRAFSLIVFALALAALTSAVAQKTTERVVIAMNADAESLAPLIIQDATTHMMIFNVYEALYQPNLDAEPTPVLAAAYSLVDDLTWEFELRQNVVFHDGTGFDALDVKATFEFILDPENLSLRRSLIDKIVDVEVVDDYTVRLHTSEPVPTMLQALLMIRIVPSELLEQGGAQAVVESPVGTGPFQILEWLPDQRLVLSAFPEYHAGQPEVSEIEFRIIPDVSSRIAALLAGEVDIVTDLPPNIVPRVEAAPNVNVREALSGRVIYIGLNNLITGPLQDVRVRQAINHAVNVDLLIDALLGGHVTRLAGPLPDLNIHSDQSLQAYEYDPELARQLLREAGYENGFDLVLHTPDGRYQQDREAAEAVAGQLAAVGITAQVRVHEWASYLELVQNREVEEMFLFSRNDTLFEGASISQFFHSELPYVVFSSDAIDEALGRAEQIVDPVERTDLFNEAQRVIHAEAPWLFLWQQHGVYGVNNRVAWDPHPMGFLHMKDARIVD